MGYRKLPWDEIRAAYTLGWEENGQRVYPDFKDLQKKYGMCSDSLWRHSKAEDWHTLRSKNQMQIRTKAEAKAIEILGDKLGDKLAEVNLHGVDGALGMMQVARALLQGCLETYKEFLKLVPLSQKELEVARRLETLKTLGVALRSFQQAHKGGLEAARLALGEPTEITEEVKTMERFFREQAALIEAEAVKGGDADA